MGANWSRVPESKQSVIYRFKLNWFLQAVVRLVFTGWKKKTKTRRRKTGQRQKRTICWISFLSQGQEVSLVFRSFAGNQLREVGLGAFARHAFLKGSLRTTFQPVEYQLDFKEQGWHSAESSRIPLMWPWFKSWRRRHMWVEVVVGSLPFSERFFSGYSGFPLSLKTNTSKFQFDLERTDMFLRIP